MHKFDEDMENQNHHTVAHTHKIAQNLDHHNIFAFPFFNNTAKEPFESRKLLACWIDVLYPWRVTRVFLRLRATYRLIVSIRGVDDDATVPKNPTFVQRRQLSMSRQTPEGGLLLNWPLTSPCKCRRVCSQEGGREGHIGGKVL